MLCGIKAGSFETIEAHSFEAFFFNKMYAQCLQRGRVSMHFNSFGVPNRFIIEIHMKHVNIIY